MDTLHGEYKIRSNIERVVDYIEDKVKDDANKIKAYLLFTKKLFKDCSFKHAHSLLSEGMQKHKSSSGLIIEFAKLKFVTQLYPEAASSFADALKYQDIDYLQTVYNLGLSYLHMSKNEESIIHLK